MPNSYFQFKQFLVQQDACAMKVTTDSCLFGAWCALEIEKATAGKTLLDIGTGTGLLALMVRQKNKLAIDAVEINTAAAAQALQNINASPWPEDFIILNNDVLHMDFSKQYDHIICNPPFYEHQLQSPNNQRNTAHHSTQLPLQGLLTIIANALKKSGTFFLLLPFKRLDEVRALFKKNALWVAKEISVQQSPNHIPFRVMLWGGKAEAALQTGTIVIRNIENQYTPEFTTLLKDYYLHF